MPANSLNKSLEGPPASPERVNLVATEAIRAQARDGGRGLNQAPSNAVATGTMGRTLVLSR